MSIGHNTELLHLSVHIFVQEYVHASTCVSARLCLRQSHTDAHVAVLLHKTRKSNIAFISLLRKDLSETQQSPGDVQLLCTIAPPLDLSLLYQEQVSQLIQLLVTTFRTIMFLSTCCFSYSPWLLLLFSSFAGATWFRSL